MKKLLMALTVFVPMFPFIAQAQFNPSINQPGPVSLEPAPEVPKYAAHSWTYNLDFKDPDALAAFVGREVVEGQWKAGCRYDPLSVYRVDEAAGEATRWVRVGAMVVTNAEHLNATVGPHIGLEILRWTSNTQVAGPVKSAASHWKPLGYFGMTATIDVFGGLTPIHTSDVKHWYSGGLGFSLQGKFGSPNEAIKIANDIIKAGL